MSGQAALSLVILADSGAARLPGGADNAGSDQHVRDQWVGRSATAVVYGSVGHARPTEQSGREVGAGEVGVAEVGAAEVDEAEVGVAEVGAAEVGAGEVRVGR